MKVNSVIVLISIAAATVFLADATPRVLLSCRKCRRIRSQLDICKRSCNRSNRKARAKQACQKNKCSKLKSRAASCLKSCPQLRQKQNLKKPAGDACTKTSQCAKNRACARKYDNKNKNNPKICCPSGKSVHDKKLQISVCTNQELHARCSSHAMCASRLCSKDPYPSTIRRCKLKRMARCSDDSDCANSACAHELYDKSSPKICCQYDHWESDTYTDVYGTEITFCMNQEAGKPCGANYHCMNNVCVEGTCLSGVQHTGRECDDDKDCHSGVCIETTGKCAPHKSLVLSGHPCGNDSDCANDSCIEQVCAQGCISNDHCKFYYGPEAVCVKEWCRSGKQADGKPCDSYLQGNECLSGDCARRELVWSADPAYLVCCWNGVFQSNGEFFCKNMKEGSKCSNILPGGKRFDACETGACVHERCVYNSNGECDDKYDCDGGNGECFGGSHLEVGVCIYQ